MFNRLPPSGTDHRQESAHRHQRDWRRSQAEVNRMAWENYAALKVCEKDGILATEAEIREMILREFTIQAISKGSDDVGKVHMQVEYDGVNYYGLGANTDIISASVEEYIDCIKKFRE